MTIRISDAARNAAANAIAALANAGAAGGTIRIYSGAQPAGPATAPTGTLLATVTLADPAYDTSSSPAGLAALAGVPLAATGVGDGTAGWFRLADSDGVAVLDGSVTATGGGGDLTLNTTTISTGVDVSITSGSITMAAS